MNASAINWSECVKQTNNRPDLAQQLLDMLALELPEFKKKIINAYENKQLSELKKNVHKLHGACCYCGANQLKVMLHDLENNIDALSSHEIRVRMNNLINEIQRVQDALSTQNYK